MNDFVIRGVSLYGKEEIDAAVSDGKWIAIRKTSGSGYGKKSKGAGKILMPGVVDAHVHFNEPGRADWEGIATGSRLCRQGAELRFSTCRSTHHRRFSMRKGWWKSDAFARKSRGLISESGEG